MMDVSPAWLIKNPKTLLLPGDVVDGKPGNGSLHWRIPRELRDTKRDGHLAGGGGAPSPQDGQIAFNIAFDVNNSLLLITLGLLVALYLTATICLMIKRWWGGRKPLYILKWPPTSIKSANPYLVTIVTGSKKDAGTDGTFVFSIHGLNHSSDQYFINGRTVHHDRKLLTQCGSDTFLITCDEPLGNISEASVTLWAMDPDEKLFLNYITIQDIKRNVFTYLPLHKWVHATDLGTEELIIEAKHKKTLHQAFDNIVCGFCERDIWVAPWLSTTLGSKLDSVYCATLCYLTITCFTFAAVVFFYTPSYEKHGYMTPSAVLFVVIAVVIVTCLVTCFHMAMRLIRVGAGDFAERYTPVLLRDMSTSPHVHWQMDADQPSSSRRSKAGGPSDRRQRRMSDPDGNSTRNNSNPDGPLWGKEHPRLSTPRRIVSRGAQFNNSNRSRGDIFQAFPSSSLRATDDSKPCFPSGDKSGFLPSGDKMGFLPGGDKFGFLPGGDKKGFLPGGDKSCFAPRGDDACAIRDNFTKTHFTAGGNFTQSKGFMSSCRPTAQDPSFNSKSKDANLLGSWGKLARSNSGFGSKKGPPTSAKIASRRYDSHLDVPGWCVPQQRNSCLKNTNSDVACPPVFPLSTSTGQAPTTRNVAFKYSMDSDDDICSRYFAKPSNSDPSRNICGSSLPRSEDWRIPMSNSGPNDTRFSSRSYGPSSRVRLNETKIFRSRGAYEDHCWGLDDATPKEDYVERSMCRGMASTKKFSFPKQSEIVCVDRCGNNRPANDPCYGMTPTLSPSLQTCDRAEQDPCSFKSDDCMPCDFQVQDCDRIQGGDVERSWNALWSNVKPGDGGAGLSKGDPNVCQTSGEVSGPVLTEMRGFAGQLVENIISKIKKQLTSPNQTVDLADCEFDIESFVRRMSQRMVGASAPTDFGCGGQSSGPCDSPCAPPIFDDCGGGGGGGRCAPDPLTDKIAKTVTDGALKNSMAMLDERVAAIVRDVEKVRANIIERMRQELGLGPEGDGKELRPPARQCGVSASDTSVMMSGKPKPRRHAPGYLPRDDISPAMTDAKLKKVARSSLENVMNRDMLGSMRDNTQATAEGDLKTFANDVVQSLYMAVRTKLQQMLKHEYDLADDGTVPFPTEELLKKADLEVQEQVLPTVVEHIVWLMKEEAKVMGQLDCDMMMIAFAGQYVDTIVTNAVLKTHVDLTQKRAYTRTFVVTSNSNKTNTNSSNDNSNNSNNNNNNLGSMLDRCLNETTLSMETLASLSVTRLEVEEVLRETSVHDTVDAEMAQLQILCSLVEKFITRQRAVRGDATRAAETSTAMVQRVGDADLEAGRDEAECPHCRTEAAQCVVARCLTPISARMITDLILEEATKNLDACGRIVESNLVRCNQETMVALGRALLDGSRGSREHLMILESVTADLKAVSLDQATAKVVDDLMAIGDSSRSEAERELRRRLNRFTEEARRKTEKMMMKTAIRENHQQNNNSHLEVDYYPRSENNINCNAATPASKAAGEGRGPPAASRAGEERDTPLVGGSDNPINDAPDAGDSDSNPIKNDMDEDKIVDEMIGIRNSLTRIADEDDCLTGKCRRHRGRLSRTLPSSRCEALHYGDTEFTDDQPSRTVTSHHLSQTLNDIEGTTLSDLWRDPTGFRHRCLIFLGNLLLGFVLLLVASLVIGCIVLGLQLTPSQAGLWLLLALSATVLHALLFEPVKVLVLAAYWTVCRNDLIQ